MLGGDKGIREERSDGIASEKAKESKEARGFYRKAVKGRCERQPAGVCAEGAHFESKVRNPQVNKKNRGELPRLFGGDKGILLLLLARHPVLFK